MKGEYICQSGKYRVTLHLDLNEQPSHFACPSDHELYFPDDHFANHRRQSTKLVHEPPRTANFTATKDIYVNEGISHAELKCRVLTDHAQVEWLRNEQPLKPSAKYELLNRGNDRILLIKEPTSVDNGDYVCQSGKHRVTLSLNVNAASGAGITPHMYSSVDDSVFARGTNRESELVFFERQQATLKCQVANEAEKVIWLKDNSYVPHNDKFVCVEDGPFRLLHVKVSCLFLKRCGNI